MTEFMEFVPRHPWLFGGLVGVVTLILYSEFQRLTQKFVDLSPQQVVQAMNQENSLLLDVRDSKEVRDGMISGAKHIPLADLQKRLSELQNAKDKKIITYCRSGHRSATACKLLSKNDFQDIAHLQGGVMAWSSANLPLKNK